MSQPSANEADNYSRSIPSHVSYLFATGLAAVVALMLLIVDAVGKLDVSRGVYAMVGSTGCACFGGYLVRSLQAELIRQLEESDRPERAGGLDPESMHAARQISTRLMQRNGATRS